MGPSSESLTGSPQKPKRRTPRWYPFAGPPTRLARAAPLGRRTAGTAARAHIASPLVFAHLRTDETSVPVEDREAPRAGGRQVLDRYGHVVTAGLRLNLHPGRARTVTRARPGRRTRPAAPSEQP